MQFQDYYEILGIPRDADAKAIKKAYRKQALKWHPDRHKDGAKAAAEVEFKRLTEAHEVLNDPEKRSRYDRFGEHWEHGQDFTPPPGNQAMNREEFEGEFGNSFSDFFAQMFGKQYREHAGAGQQRHPRYRYRGADVRADLELPLTSAIDGGTSSFKFPATAACARCGGVGFLDQHACSTCGGVGVTHERKSIDLKIPKDVRDGMVVRLRGMGHPGNEGGDTGDLHLKIHLRADRNYRLVEDGLEADVKIAPWEALSGTKLDVRAPNGVVTVNLAPNTAAGTRQRLRGQGISDGRGGRGDFFIVVRLALPEDLTDRQRQLLEEAGQAGPQSPFAGTRQGGASHESS
ncbi:MAG: DnaJ-class molecular chaperone [Planctomycetota bacterium]|jgi:DnaJ-class molecular chaperone